VFVLCTYLDAGPTFAVHIRAAELGVLDGVDRVRRVAINEAQGPAPGSGSRDAPGTSALGLGRGESAEP